MFIFLFVFLIRFHPTDLWKEITSKHLNFYKAALVLRKYLVIELQMELLNVDLDMNETVRHNHVRDVTVFSSILKYWRKQSPKIIPWRRRFHVLVTFYLKSTYFLGLSFKYLEAGCRFVFIFPFIFSMNMQELKS